MADMNFASFSGATYAATLAQQVRLEVFDPATLTGSRYLLYAGSMNGSASDTVSVPKVNLGALTASSVAEGASAPRTSLAFTTASLALGRLVLAIGQTDLARIQLRYGSLDVAALSSWIAWGLQTRATTLIAALMGGFANTAGATTVDLSVDNVISAMLALELNCFSPPPFLAVWHGRQFGDFRTSLRGETGAVEFMPATAAMIEAKGPGFKGSWGNVEIVTNSRIPTANAGADRAGGMIAPGAIHWTDGIAPPTPGS